MWICTNNSFLSVVDKATNPDCLLVRARRKEHIEAVFPGAKIVETVRRDYLYRAEILRPAVASAIAEAVLSIDYDNFKNSVDDDDLHDAYSQVWSVMGRLQDGGPYGWCQSESLG